MGPLFAIILFFIAAFSVLGFLAVFVAIAYSVNDRQDWLKYAARIPVVVMLLIGLGIVSMAFYDLIYDPIASLNPRRVFKKAFDQAPGSQVSEIQSSYYRFGDSCDFTLRFKTNEAEFRRLASARIEPRSFEQIKNVDQIQYETHSLDLSWWDFKLDKKWIYFHERRSSAVEGGKGYTEETEYCAYDPFKGVGYYRYIGVD